MKRKIIYTLTPLIIAMPVALAVSCGFKKDKTKTSDSHGQNKNETNTPEKPLAVGDYKIGFWNILNDGKGKGYKNSAIAKVIKYNKMTMVGLAEVDDTKAVIAIANYLSEYTNNPWKAVYTKHKSGTLAGGSSATVEHYGFVYRTDLYTPENFDNTTEPGAIYANPKSSGKQYKRPPFGVKFKTKNSEFTAAIIHADGPGKGRGESKDQHGNGAQEVWEANNLPTVMDWFDQHDGSNKNMIFMGDTNIHTTYNNKPFKPLIDRGYKPMLKLGSSNSTSLGTKVDKYANTYDKIFTNINSANSGDYYKLYNVFKDNIIDQQTLLKETVDANKHYKNLIRSAISDHCPVWAIYDL